MKRVPINVPFVTFNIMANAFFIIFAWSVHSWRKDHATSVSGFSDIQ